MMTMGMMKKFNNYLVSRKNTVVNLHACVIEFVAHLIMNHVVHGIAYRFLCWVGWLAFARHTIGTEDDAVVHVELQRRRNEKYTLIQSRMS